MFDLKGLISGWWARHKARGYVKRLEDEAADELLEGLLKMMKLAFWLSPDYRRNIENFTGSYRFQDKDGGVNVLVKFHNGDMTFSSKDPDPEANVTVIFTDSKALMNFLLADFGEALRNFLSADTRVLWDILHANFGHGLRDFLLARNQALRDFLGAFKKDILKVMETNEVRVIGNLNYLYKFGFMANHPIHRLLNLANKLT
jgi:hypothetical protein